MSDSDIDPGILIFVDRQSKAETAVIALVAKDEFAWGQIVVPDLNAYSDYGEWRESREGFQMGLAMAGVDVRMVPIALTPFLAWCRLTGTAPDERALDAFASTILRFRTPPEPTVLAVVREQEFEAHSRNVAALSGYCDYQQWLRHRRAIRANAAASGLDVEELPILVDDFIEWSACVSQISESSIDRYAQLVLEHFACDFNEWESQTFPEHFDGESSDV
jgi:hypothetical protein